MPRSAAMPSQSTHHTAAAAPPTKLPPPPALPKGKLVDWQKAKLAKRRRYLDRVKQQQQQQQQAIQCTTRFQFHPPSNTNTTTTMMPTMMPISTTMDNYNNNKRHQDGKEGSGDDGITNINTRKSDNTDKWNRLLDGLWLFDNTHHANPPSTSTATLEKSHLSLKRREEDVSQSDTNSQTQRNTETTFTQLMDVREKETTPTINDNGESAKTAHPEKPTYSTARTSHIAKSTSEDGTNDSPVGITQPRKTQRHRLFRSLPICRPLPNGGGIHMTETHECNEYYDDFVNDAGDASMKGDYEKTMDSTAKVRVFDFNLTFDKHTQHTLDIDLSLIHILYFVFTSIMIHVIKSPISPPPPHTRKRTFVTDISLPKRLITAPLQSKTTNEVTSMHSRVNLYGNISPRNSTAEC